MMIIVTRACDQRANPLHTKRIQLRNSVRILIRTSMEVYFILVKRKV